jgi:hypothetical protein
LCQVVPRCARMCLGVPRDRACGSSAGSRLCQVVPGCVRL